MRASCLLVATYLCFISLRREKVSYVVRTTQLSPQQCCCRLHASRWSSNGLRILSWQRVAVKLSEALWCASLVLVLTRNMYLTPF